MTSSTSNFHIDDQPPQVAWYGQNKMIMVDAKEIEKLNSEICNLRQEHIEIRKLLQKYELEVVEEKHSLRTLEFAFKDSLRTQAHDSSVNEQQLRQHIAKQDLQHLASIQNLKNEIEQLKLKYERQINALKQKNEFLENKTALDQQRVENWLIRTHKSFPYSIASSTSWLNKWTTNTTPSNNQAAVPTLSSANAITSAISSLIGSNTHNNLYRQC